MQPARSQSPKQLERASTAIALSMGIALGVMPKLNLTAFAILAFLSLANQFTRQVAIVGVVSFLFSGILSPVLQSFGIIAFGFPPVRYLLTVAEQLPILPWFRFNNPVVLGSLCTGIAAYVSLVLVGFLMFSARSRKTTETNVNAVPLAMLDDFSHADDIEFARVEFVSFTGVTETKSIVLATSPATAPEYRTKPDDSVYSFENQASSSGQISPRNTIQNAVASTALEDYSNMEIRESIIEIVRFRNHKEAGLQQADSTSWGAAANANPDKLISLPIHNLMHTTTQSNSIIVTDPKSAGDATRGITPAITNAERSMEKTMNLIESELESVAPTEAIVSNNQVRHESPQIQQDAEVKPKTKPRDEALRYLLWHLSEAKDQPIIRERAS